MSEARQTQPSSELSDPPHSTSRLARGLRVLSLIFKDRNLRSSVKALLYHLSTLNESSPRQFALNIAAWGRHLSVVQSYYRFPETTSNESVVEWYPELSDRIADEIANFQHQPKFTILIPVSAATLSKLERTLRSVQEQFYSNLELCIVTQPESVDQVVSLSSKILGADGLVKVMSGEHAGDNLASSLDRAVQECPGNFVGFLSAGDRLPRNALFEVVRLINQHPDADIVYTDEELKAGDYYARAFHKPAWSPDLFLSFDYLRNFLCCRTEAIRAAGVLRGSTEDDIKYDLLLRMIRRTQRIHHIALILYHEQVGKLVSPPLLSAQSSELYVGALQDHLKRSQIDGTVSEGCFPGSFRVRRNLLGDPRVSIIIPTRDKVDLLERCLESIASTTSYRNYEIIVVDNASSDSRTLAYLERLPHRVIRYPGPFNFSQLNNLAAREAGGNHLLFLNNDTEVIASGWLEAMLEHSQRPEVGAVGAKLLYPDGTIQHAGMGLKPSHIALHLHRFRGPNEHGYHGLADVIRNLNAVTGACLMTKASLFNEVGGFDETLPLTYNDVDLCLKLRARGYLTVYTPFALLYHHEGISTNAGEIIEIEVSEENRPRHYRIAVPEGQGEQVKRFYAHWKDFIESDRYYVLEELA
jgi:GT2 family glycosyltransferase